MLYDDHPPPHFHAEYGEYKISVEIESGVVEGRFPRRAMRAILEWADLHHDDLLENWIGLAGISGSIGSLPWSSNMLEVTAAEYIDGYRIRLRFSDGAVGVTDLTDSLWGPMFEPLRDLDRFKQFTVSGDLHTICWDNCADLAPSSSTRRRSNRAA